ncbi:MAG: hypothetical protein NC089_10915 [Bacteroides sp.]|nr:hypothetical protein [Bacteroides sp.]MCM1550392.1 hypothetical protein [Clostridium sp.]
MQSSRREWQSNRTETSGWKKWQSNRTELRVIGENCKTAGRNYKQLKKNAKQPDEIANWLGSK